jgi:hypothetical protein
MEWMDHYSSELLSSKSEYMCGESGTAFCDMTLARSGAEVVLTSFSNRLKDCRAFFDSSRSSVEPFFKQFTSVERVESDSRRSMFWSSIPSIQESSHDQTGQRDKQREREREREFWRMQVCMLQMKTRETVKIKTNLKQRNGKKMLEE